MNLELHGQSNAYNHFTLLVYANEANFAVERKENSIITNVTTSTQSKIKHLSDINRNIQVRKFMFDISRKYLDMKSPVFKDTGVIERPEGIRFIYPTEY
ncbi:hypothetical protein ACS0PU_004839 [Formica fusca]